MKLYYCSIEELHDLAGARLLPPARRARMEQYRYADDRARCLAAGLLLRAALGDRGAALREDPLGKPYLPGGPCFNLSHSGSLAVLGVSDSPLGVDVEKLAPWKDKVARRCCTPDELDWLYAQEDARAFYRLWTAKESVMKATGQGLSMSPGGFSVLPVADGEHRIHNQSWFLTWLDLPGHQVCAAGASPEPVSPLRLRREQLLLEHARGLYAEIP